VNIINVSATIRSGVLERLFLAFIAIILSSVKTLMISA
jgi:hypothetical protein